MIKATGGDDILMTIFSEARSQAYLFGFWNCKSKTGVRRPVYDSKF